MGAKFQKHKQGSVVKSALEDKKSSLTNDPQNLNFSFEDFCSKQSYASGYLDWQNSGLLANALDTISGFCKSQLPLSDPSGKFTIYGDFPKHGYTLYKYPEHVSPDARWARIHINGAAVIIGHIIRNTFYVVF